MALVRSPSSGNLLLGPGGDLANSLNCCCACIQNEFCAGYSCVNCGLCDSQLLALPLGCAQSSGLACFTVTLSGLTFDTACRTKRDASCTAIGGSYKFTSASMADLVIPFGEESVGTDVRNPASPCEFNLTNMCGSWHTCGSAQDTGINVQSYATNNCSGTFITSNVLINFALLKYQFVGATQRFILQINTGSLGGGAELLLFYGVVSFDARKCSSYAAFPLTINNQLTAFACQCGASGTAYHIAANGGTATLALRCDHPDCSSIGLLP